MLLLWRALPKRSTTVVVLGTLLAIVAVQYVLGSQQIQSDPQTSRRKVKVSKDFRKFSDIVGNRGYRYMKKLVRALDEQLKDCDDMEDTSVRHWVIQGYKPDYFDEDTDSVTFKTSRFNLDKNCNVSHVEFLLPLVRSDTKDRVWSIYINGQKHTHSGGTVGIEHAAIFNLTGTRLLKDHVEFFNVSVTPSSSLGNLPRQSVLFFYCNINDTILQKLQTYQQRPPVRSQSPPSSEHVTINLEDVVDFKVISTSDPNGAKLGAPCDEQSKTCSDANLDTVRKQETNLTTGGRRSMDQNWLSLQGNEPPSPRQNVEAMTVEDIDTASPARQERSRLTDDFTPDDIATPALQRKRRSSCLRNAGESVCACRREALWVRLRSPLPDTDIPGSKRPTDLGRCVGSCSHALSLDGIGDNVTAHAVLLNLHKNPEVAGSVTCAAHKMASVPQLIHHTKTGWLEMKILQNLRIMSCRCV